VFDNADDPSLLSPYWPNTSHGCIIVTSRNPTTREEGFAQRGLHLKAFEDDEGSKFLASLLDLGDALAEEDLAAAHSLSRRFGGLPLALRQAAAFMRSKKCSPAQFAQLYGHRFNEIDGFAIQGYHRTVVDVWKLSMDTLSEHSLILLDILAILDPDSIPMEIFHVTGIENTHGNFMQDPLRVLDAIEGLANQSLIDHSPHCKSLNLHRFFQEATFRRLSTDIQRFTNVVQLGIELIHKFIPNDDFTSVRQPQKWTIIEKCMSHVYSIFSRCFHNISENGSERLLACLSDLLKSVIPH
jgi:hypothetical protein